MAGPVFYSTNPWISSEIAKRYRGSTYFVWCSQYYDPTSAPPGTAEAAIAPSSSPKGIYDTLLGDCGREDTHSTLIKGYKKKFRSLATAWLADGSIDQTQYDEIVATINSKSWRIWRPILYVIPRGLIAPSRIHHVEAKKRAAYGPEMQIRDLQCDEFDIIER